MTRLPLTVCMMVRDEEQNLPRCLASLAHLVSEIIVVDTGSVDGTVEILRQFDATIIHTDWQWDFAKTRNLGLAHAKQPWILSIDADEELSAPDIDYFCSLLACPDVHGYFVKIRNHLRNTEDGGYITDSACRLFRNHPKIRFTGTIHETVIPHIQDMAAHIEFSQLTLNHYGYTPESVASKDKNARNLRIIRNALQRNPEDTTLQYALATEYFQQEKYAESFAILYLLLTKVPVSVGYASDIVLKAAYALRSLGRLAEAMDVLTAGRQHFADFPDLLDLQATLMIQSGDYVGAKNLLEQSTYMGDMSHKYTSSSGVGTYVSCLLSGITEELLGNFAEALKLYQRGIEQSPNYTPLWKRCALLTLGMGLDEALFSCLQRHGTTLSDSVWKVVFQALVDHRHPHVTRTVMACCPTGLADPFLDAVLCAQEGNLGGAEGRFSQLLQNEQLSGVAGMYLWSIAVRNGHSETEIHALMDSLGVEKFGTSRRCTTLRSDASVLPTHRYRSIQRALLQIGALDGWLTFQQRFTPAQGPWLPLHVPLGWIDLPKVTRQQLLSLAKTRPLELGRMEHALLGLLCLESRDPQQALNWFRFVEPSAVPDIVLTSGTYASYLELAREHLGEDLKHELHLNVRGLLVHLLSYI